MDQNKRIPSSAFIYIFARWRQLKLIILELDEIDDLVFVYTQISLNSISEYSFLSCVCALKAWYPALLFGCWGCMLYAG